MIGQLHMYNHEDHKKKIMVIAEAGVNHNGEYTKAIELIDIAADCGADFVKFQTLVKSGYH